ncbi:MAG: ABC transporter ATP-binding protein [Solirubrobacteraceae bacterium]
MSVRRGRADVVVGVGFELAPGSVTGLLGPSGCGKTTLMRSIVGVQQRVRGELRVLGAEAGAPELRSRVGYLTQAPSIYADLTVRENMEYFARIQRADAQRIPELLGRVGLGSLAGQLVRTLSGGELARASLATVLLGEPELLILDEPTVGLDPLLRRSLWEFFGELAGRGATLLVSSHVMDEASHCQELLLMREGRLIAQVTPAELARQAGTSDLDEAFLRLVGGDA